MRTEALRSDREKREDVKRRRCSGSSSSGDDGGCAAREACSNGETVAVVMSQGFESAAAL